jgi:hypothetical protein
VEPRTLEDRARLALNCLARNVDPDWRRLPYFWTHLKPSPPVARHGIGPFDFGDIAGRWVDALALARRMTGSDSAEETEGILRDYFLTLLDDEDGLCYSEKTPWCEREVEIGCERGALLALVTWLLDTGDDYIAWLIERLIRGLLSIATIEGSTLRFPHKIYRRGRWVASSGPGEPAYQGFILTPVVRFYEATGSRDAQRFARLFANHIITARGAFGQDGSFTGHTHTRMGTAAGLIRAGTALADQRIFDFGRRIYEWSRSITASTGWMPEFLGRYPLNEEGCETCTLSDALDCALLLAKAGHEECWDDAERLLRNQLAENQLTDVRWMASAKRRLGLPVKGKRRKDTLKATYDNVAARVNGGFAGWARPNDLVGTTHKDARNWAMMHCCSPAGARALYLAWQSVVTERDGTVFVNLHLDRDARAGELRSHRPYEGRLVFGLARKRRLRVRLPGWLDARALRVYVNARRVAPKVRGRWLVLDDAGAADVVSVNYPLPRREGWEVIGGRTFRLKWKGDTVTRFEPAGEFRPLYQRKRFERNTAPAGAPKLHAPKEALVW